MSLLWANIVVVVGLLLLVAIVGLVGYITWWELRESAHEIEKHRAFFCDLFPDQDGAAEESRGTEGRR